MEQMFIQKDGLLYTPDGKTIIGVDVDSTAFSGKVPYGARAIDEEVFNECPFESISLPDSIESLGYRLFANSLTLETVKLPPELKELAPYMFSGCKALTKVYMPNELNGFPEGLFNECSALEEIPFRAGIKVLPQYVFSKCTSLTSLVIPDTVQRIESNAVSYCTSLSALVLPASLEYLADNAFEGCTSIHNIRIDQSNKIFFVNEEDGCLYEHTADGDKLRIATSQVQRQQVSFFKDNVDDESDDFFSDEDFDEIDETFSSSVSATDEEVKVLDATSALQTTSVSEKESTEDPQALGLSDEEKALMMGDKPAAEEPAVIEEIPEAPAVEEITEAPSESPAEETQNQITQESTMEQNDQDVDGLLEDIMSEEKQRDTVSSDVLVDENETKVLSQMMDVMSDAPTETAESKVSDEELVNLLSPSEKPQKLDDTEQKIKILTQSVKKYQILEFNPQGELPAKTDLFVIAENLIQDEQGQDVFTPKLLRCCNTFAHIQNFKRVILLNGLPFENPEFENFYSGFMATKNIVLACEAQSPATLSEYAKKICSESRISLEKEELVTQRKRISTKNNSMIKLVIQDIYDN